MSDRAPDAQTIWLNNSVGFGHALNCIRLHPAVSSRLNEQAIGDLLLFDINYNLESTTFADIQILRTAHSLTLSDNQLQTPHRGF